MSDSPLRGGHSSPDARRTLLLTMLATSAASLPVFLIGALSVFVRQDLGFTEIELGWAVSSYFVAAAAASIPGGRLGERFGARSVMTISAAATGLALIAIGAFVESLFALIGALCLAGVASSWVEPSANLALATSAPRKRQGLYFGWKQASVPLAGFLAGWSVPLIGVTLGWRWAFIGAFGIAVAAVVSLVRNGSAIKRSPPVPGIRVVDRALIAMAIAGGMGMAGVMSIQTFFVEAMVSGGMDPSKAGALLAFGGVLGVAARVFWGWRADRKTIGGSQMVAALLVAGAAGCVALAFPYWSATRWLGPILAFAGGWGWTGLFHLTVVRSHPEAPSAASGFASLGGRLGGIFGPLTFGFAVVHLGFGTAWIGTAVALTIGAVAALTAAVIDQDQTSVTDVVFS